VTFHQQTEPLISYYRQAGLLHEINGEDDVDQITAKMIAAIRSISPAIEIAEFTSSR
jgi:adenylate kinase family enzyme